ncbi:hypothetical protein DL93DRAFT_2092700 [Clavulina sp. PMI_390]|nr:hypothetical protein DL93DRAFT_2092700 [Clavulina sp. PMI_390]
MPSSTSSRSPERAFGSSPNASTAPSTLSLILSEEGWKNVDISSQSRILYSIRTVKKGNFVSTKTVTSITRHRRQSETSTADAPVAVIEWNKKGGTKITYKGVENELDSLLPRQEWHSREVQTLSGTWVWSILGEEPPELLDNAGRCIASHRRNTRLFKKSLPNTLEIVPSALDLLGLDMIIVGWVVMMREAESQPPAYD